MWEGFPLERRDPQLTDRIRGRFRTVATAIFAAAFVLTAVSALIAWKIPYSPDLYHLLYARTGSSKAENSYEFLFVFPAFLWGCALLLWFDPGGMLRKRCRDDERAIAACVLNGAGACAFAVMALLRDGDAWHHYF